MAGARTVVDDVDEQASNVFEGIKFFLVQRVPIRGHLIKSIENNGGRVVKLEAQADHIVADHMRPDAPATSVSYTFIEAAVRDGQLPDPEDHRAGPRETTARPVGSTAPSKGTRTPFTDEDDRVLREWVHDHSINLKGNEIYKQLEAKNPRHTWQSWRDRYVKRLALLPPPRVGTQPPRQAPARPETEPTEIETVAKSTVKSEQDFTRKDFNTLLLNAKDIENLDPKSRKHAWDTYAESYPAHCGDAWRDFYTRFVQPAYRAAADVEYPAEGQTTTDQEPIPTTPLKVPTVVHDRNADSARSGTTSRKRRRSSPEANTNSPKKHRAVSGAAEEPHAAQDNARMSDSTHRNADPASGNEVGRSALLNGRGNLGDGGDVLTEKNLARHMAQNHRKSGRAADLPEDDDAESQTRYIEHLQNLIGTRDEPASETSERPPRSRPSTEHIPADMDAGKSAEEPLFVSDGSVDDQIIRDTLDWPNSPKAATGPTPVSDRNQLAGESTPGQPSNPIRSKSRAAPDRLEESSQLGQQSPYMYPPLPGLVFQPTQPLRDQLQSEDDVAIGEADEGDARSGSDDYEIDLGVPAPEGGFQFSSSPAHGSDLPTTNGGGRRAGALDTQDILNAETQWPDLTVAPPAIESELEDDNDEADHYDRDDSEEVTPQSLRHSGHKMTGGRDKSAEMHDEGSGTFATALVQNDSADAAAYITDKVGQGYAEAAVINALERTSMLPDLADIVLLCDKAGEAFPDDVPGIWSTEEDAQLEGEDANAIRRLEEKHGTENLDWRLEFLESMREE